MEKYQVIGGSLRPLVSITIVTTNDLRHIPGCLDSIFAMDYSPFEVIIIDNNSTDGSRHFREQTRYPIHAEYNNTNKGFSAAQNLAIRRANGNWILCLNPDTRLRPQFLSELVRAGESHPEIGILCPKMLRMGPTGIPARGRAVFALAGFSSHVRPVEIHNKTESDFPIGKSGLRLGMRSIYCESCDGVRQLWAVFRCGKILLRVASDFADIKGDKHTICQRPDRLGCDPKEF